MCGLSGIIAHHQIESSAMYASLEAIKHRGPNDTRIFSEGSLFSCALSTVLSKEQYPQIDDSFKSDCFLGFNRLSIVDLSEHGMQPFYQKDRGIAFMMNGEVYNYRELRAQYLADTEFNSETDSEVAFRLYLKLGDDFVHHLRGMFAIVVYDYQAESLKVWRDRLGIKPFYYALTDEGLIFSSEMKGIFATKMVDKELDYTGLAYSMYLTTCPAPLTIYNHISSLQAGHCLEYRKGASGPTTSCYWHLQYEPSQRKISFEEFDEDMTSLCSLYRTEEVERAIMLSGGIDSGLLSYYLGKIDNGMQCINIFATDHPTDEREYAIINAENAALPLSFLEMPINPTLTMVEEYLTSEEEPNSSPEATFFLSKGAHKMGIKVLYNALGPDELFGGYAYFKTIAKYTIIIPLLKLLPQVCLPPKYRTKISEIKEYGFYAYPFFCRSLFSWQEVTEFLRSKNREVPQHPVAYIEAQIASIYPAFNNLSTLKKSSYFEVFYYISSHHSFRSDQPSMKYSIEMRFPFLDHLFLQKYFNQVDSFAGISKELKHQFRNYARKVLSPKVFQMNKRGFSMPINFTENGDETKAKMKEWYWKMLNQICN